MYFDKPKNIYKYHYCFTRLSGVKKNVEIDKIITTLLIFCHYFIQTFAVIHAGWLLICIENTTFVVTFTHKTKN